MDALLKYHNAAIELFPANELFKEGINLFLEEYNDSIIDIQLSGDRIMIVYKCKED